MTEQTPKPNKPNGYVDSETEVNSEIRKAHSVTLLTIYSNYFKKNKEYFTVSDLNYIAEVYHSENQWVLDIFRYGKLEEVHESETLQDGFDYLDWKYGEQSDTM